MTNDLISCDSIKGNLELYFIVSIKTEEIKSYRISLTSKWIDWLYKCRKIGCRGRKTRDYDGKLEVKYPLTNLFTANIMHIMSKQLQIKKELGIHETTEVEKDIYILINKGILEKKIPERYKPEIYRLKNCYNNKANYDVTKRTLLYKMVLSEPALEVYDRYFSTFNYDQLMLIKYMKALCTPSGISFDDAVDNLLKKTMNDLHLKLEGNENENENNSAEKQQ